MNDKTSSTTPPADTANPGNAPDTPVAGPGGPPSGHGVPRGPEEPDFYEQSPARGDADGEPRDFVQVPDVPPPGPHPDDPPVGFEKIIPDVPPQELKLRPGKKSQALSAVIADERTGRFVECRRLHPRITLELTLEPGQMLLIRPLDDDGHAELLADVGAELKDPAG